MSPLPLHTADALPYCLSFAQCKNWQPRFSVTLTVDLDGMVVEALCFSWLTVAVLELSELSKCHSRGKFKLISTLVCLHRCVFDNRPRKVDATSAQILSNIAELAMRELEKKWAMQLERACLDHVLRSLDCYDQGFLFVEASRADWQIIHVSPAAAQETGAVPF